MARMTMTFGVLCLSLVVSVSLAFQVPSPQHRVPQVSKPIIPATPTTTTTIQSSTTIEGFSTATIPTPLIPNEGRVRNENDPPMQGAIMKMLPKSSFQVDTLTSLGYFGIDMAAVMATMGFLYTVVTSDIYHAMPVWQQGLAVAPLQVLTGFAMWCMWCIGHDAGHSLISKSKPWLNGVVGEIAHSMFCLTPFVPWQLSHRKHHLNHNHLTKDYSHQWFVREEQKDLPPWIQWSYKTRNTQLPLLYLVYLLFGVPDGGHVVLYGRLWKDEPLKLKIRGTISSIISLATAGSLWMSMGTANFAVVCLAPWLVMSFWLFMVTYLQHHSEDGKLYTDDSWTFQRGAFETVDRTYGKWVDRMSHHMMDGHVIHHLFFERVPHYRLEKATDALIVGLAKEGKSDLYKRIETHAFTQEIVKQFDDNWLTIRRMQWRPIECCFSC